MWRRLKEDRNQHYDRLDCDCWTDKKAMARFKEQPKHCRSSCCWNSRRHYGFPAYAERTIQERRWLNRKALNEEGFSEITSDNTRQEESQAKEGNTSPPGSVVFKLPSAAKLVKRFSADQADAAELRPDVWLAPLAYPCGNA